jgi:hypothetical protein
VVLHAVVKQGVVDLDKRSGRKRCQMICGSSPCGAPDISPSRTASRRCHLLVCLFPEMTVIACDPHALSIDGAW